MVVFDHFICFMSEVVVPTEFTRLVIPLSSVRKIEQASSNPNGLAISTRALLVRTTSPLAQLSAFRLSTHAHLARCQYVFSFAEELAAMSVMPTIVQLWASKQKRDRAHRGNSEPRYTHCHVLALFVCVTLSHSRTRVQCSTAPTPPTTTDRDDARSNLSYASRVLATLHRLVWRRCRLYHHRAILGFGAREYPSSTPRHGVAASQRREATPSDASERIPATPSRECQYQDASNR